MLYCNYAAKILLVRAIVAGICITMLAGSNGVMAQVNCQALMNEILSIPPGYGSYQRALQIQETYNRYCLGGGNQPQSSNLPKGATRCSGNTYCKQGLKCASGSKCIPQDATDCGKGVVCAAGNKCSQQGGCLPKDAVDCGSFHCAAGNVCAANNQCVPAAYAERLRGGEPIDTKTAQDVRPMAYMAADAESGSDSGARKFGFRRAGGLDILTKNGVPQADIERLRKGGFDAVVFTKAREGNTNIFIVFRGTDQVQEQRLQAVEFAKAVQKQYGDARPITLVGNAFGGALASYVASLLNQPAVTFNAPRTASSESPEASSEPPVPGKEDRPTQTNIITAGNQLSDPLANPTFTGKSGEGEKPLPGKTFVVEPKGAKDDPHSIKTVIKALEATTNVKDEDTTGANLPSCPGQWVKGDKGKLCKCTGGLFAKLDEPQNRMVCP